MMRRATFLWISGAMLPALVAVSATFGARQAVALPANAEAGADAFDRYCSDCHSVSPKLTNRKGPTLFGIFGRRAGTVNGFDYSARMRASGIVWNASNLNAYLANPQAVVPGGKMKKGLPGAADRANVIAFLSHPE